MKTRRLLVIAALAAAVVACDDDTGPSGPTPPKAPTFGLVAEYLFNGDAADSHGNNEGTLVGNPTLRQDRFGRADRAFSFDGVDDAVTTPNDDFAGVNLVSVSLWFRVPSDAVPLRFFVVSSDFGIWTNGADAGIAISVPATESAGGPFTTVGEWHHLLGTFDGFDIRCYIDGVLAQTTNHPGDISDVNHPLEMGRSNATYWAGDLDDVRIYDRVIDDPAEVFALYHEGGYDL